MGSKIIRNAKGVVSQWWKEDDPAKSMSATIRTLYGDQSARYEGILFWLRMYGEDLSNVYGFDSVTTAGADEPLPLNVTQAVIDTHVSKIVRARPRMMMLPVGGGGYSAYKLARMRTRFIDGVWQETKFRSMFREIVVDADVTGTGIIKAYVEDGRIVHERVYVEEIIVDPEDAKYGSPRSIYQIRWVDRGQLIDMYPDAEEQILSASVDGVDTRRSIRALRHVDQVLVLEGWHLPDGRLKGKCNAKPRGDESDEQFLARIKAAKWGRHVMAIDGVTLRDEPWTLQDSQGPRFPFMILHSKTPRRGFWPVGMAQRLFGYQSNINDIVEMILENIKTHGNLETWLQEGSHVLDSDLDDTIGAVRFYAGQKPVFSTPVIVSPEVYQFVWQLVSRAFSSEGQSELASHGEVPKRMAGASGAALRTITGISTGRDVMAGLNSDDAHRDMAELDLLLAQQAAEQDPKFSSLYVGKKDGEWFAQRLAFLDVDGQDREFVIEMLSTADIPNTPPGKLAFFGELEEKGLIEPGETADQFDIVSVDRVLQLKTAGRRAVEYALERIIEGEYIAPEPFMPIGTLEAPGICLQMAINQYNLAMQDEVDEAVLDDLREFITATIDLQKKLAPTPVPPPPPEGQAAPAQEIPG